MKVVSVAEMVAIEKASDAAGHSYDAMMELAGRATAAAIVRHMEPWDSSGGTLILVGPGNNGGDGLVAARYLRQWEPRRPVVIYCWKREPEGDENYAAVRRLKLPMVHVEDDPQFEQLLEWLLEADVIVDALLGTGVSRPIGGTLAELLDAVREGLRQRRAEEAQAAGDDEEKPIASSPPRVAAAALSPVQDFDFLRVPPYLEMRLPQIAAVDCPSGLNCDTGVLDPASLRAHLTVTFANPKVGHFFADGPAACGHLLVADIGTDPDLAAEVKVSLATPAGVQEHLPVRPPDGHKGTFGKAMVVAGSANFTGAAALVGAAAYRVGAGLVTLGVASSLHTALAAGLTEVTWLLLPEQLGVLSPSAVKVLREGLDGYAALVVGPGLTQEKEAVGFVHELLGVTGERRRSVGFLARRDLSQAAVGSGEEQEDAAQTGEPDKHEQAQEVAAQPPSRLRSEVAEGGIGFLSRRRQPSAPTSADPLTSIPLVLDADALNALAQVEDWPNHAHFPEMCVLTPHPGEMGRLCGCTAREVQADRVHLARQKAQEWGTVVLLKGAYTVVAAPDGQAVILPFANPALATAGAGDVLAGAIVGILSQGLAAFEAAIVGGYLHGLAGEMARDDLGDAGVVAGDLLARLPLAIRQLRGA